MCVLVKACIGIMLSLLLIKSEGSMAYINFDNMASIQVKSRESERVISQRQNIWPEFGSTYHTNTC